MNDRNAHGTSRDSGKLPPMSKSWRRGSFPTKKRDIRRRNYRLQPVKRPPILGPLELWEPDRPFRYAPSPPGHLWGDFRPPPPQFPTPPATPPLAPAPGQIEPPWIGQPHVTALTINRLTEREVGAIIDGNLCHGACHCGSLNSTPSVLAAGINSRAISTNLPDRPSTRVNIPVTLPPG